MKYQVSFRAKTWYLHMWKYHRCYGFIINRAFHTKKLLKWNGLVVHWCLYNKKKNITWPFGDTKFLFSCWKNISFVRCPHSWNIFQRSKRNFVSPRGHVIQASIYISQLVRYPTIQSSDCKRDNKPVIWFDLISFFPLNPLNDTLIVFHPYANWSRWRNRFQNILWREEIDYE